MARINVEECFWSHPGYRALVRFVGCEDKAAGMCLRAWRTAQRFWAKKELIPEYVWKLENLEVLVDVGLAERRAEGVYCRGSAKQFSWYEKMAAAGKRGGQESAKSRAEKYGSTAPAALKPTRSLNEASQNLEPEASANLSGEAPQNPLTPTPTPTLTQSIVLAKANTRPTAKALLDLWNLHCLPLPQAKSLAGKRGNAAKARLADEGDLGYWEAVVKRMAASSFCRGEGGTGWRASIDFLLRPDTHVKVMEGKYDDHSEGTPINWAAITGDEAR